MCLSMVTFPYWSIRTESGIMQTPTPIRRPTRCIRQWVTVNDNVMEVVPLRFYDQGGKLVFVAAPTPMAGDFHPSAPAHWDET